MMCNTQSTPPTSPFFPPEPAIGPLRRLPSMAVHSARASVGTPAPKFALPDAQGETVALDDLVARGPVVLVFLRGFA